MREIDLTIKIDQHVADSIFCDMLEDYFEHNCVHIGYISLPYYHSSKSRPLDMSICIDDPSVKEHFGGIEFYTENLGDELREQLKDGCFDDCQVKLRNLIFELRLLADDLEKGAELLTNKG